MEKEITFTLNDYERKITFDDLLVEIECAISATFGTTDGKEELEVTKGDLLEIARKTAFYLDLL